MKAILGIGKGFMLTGLILTLSTCSEPEKAKPEITQLVPADGQVGDEVYIKGKNFATASKVLFGTAESSIVTKKDDEILTVVPAGLTPGNTTVAVVADGGTSATMAFTVLETKPVDPLTDPVIDEVVATKNITDQLLLLRGKNLSTASIVMFGGTEANIATATSKVVTVIIPSDLTVGNYAVKVKTSKGTSEGKSFEVVSTQPDVAGGASLVNGATVTSLPSGYVPPISNQWDNPFELDGNETFLLSDNGDGTLSVNFRNNSNDAEGTGIYDQAVVDGVMNNYIEFTVNSVRYVGVWTAPTVYNTDLKKYCYHHMTLISTQSGKQLTLDVKDFECP
ncbi:IPT/TIG domain-containing protein [Ohtaekwangia sp.]|uniref:IPT/TIG domain-containing protein n=1 Tax=Ohtaekwangia sp. TaxID=2066019 RepID=UPI002F95B0E0